MEKKLSDTQIVFIKNLFLTTVLGGIIGILNYLFNIFVARYTTQEIFSTFSAALGLVYLVQIPATAIQSVVTKEVARNKGKDLNRYKWYSLGIFSLLGIIFSTLFFLARNSIADLANIPVETMLYLTITLFFAFTSPTGKGFLLGKEKIGTVNLILLLETILRFGMGALAISMEGSIPILILANSLPAMLTTLFILPLVKFKKEEVINKEETIKIDFKELILIASAFLFLSGPFMLSMPLVNPEFRAEFSAISVLGRLVYFAAVMTASVLFARITNESDESSQKKSLLISLLLSISIGGVISIIFFLFKDLVVNLTVGERYSIIGEYIGGFGLSMTAFAFVYMSANYFISKGDYKYILIPFIGTVLQIASFMFRNDTLNMVMLNQTVIYGFMAITTTIYLLFKLRKIKNGEEKFAKED
jgi:O-antigen/teichoic acid export membrane protein